MATLQWLPFTGVAIVSVSAERPLAEEDINLLKGIAQYCPEIALVITKTDLFKAEELKEIKSHISGSVQKAIKKNIPIFEYSVYKNLQQHRHFLTDHLIHPLNLNYDTKYNEITRHKTRSAIEQSLAYTELAVQSALKREQEKNSVHKLLQEIRSNRHYHEQEMLLSGSSFKGEIREKLGKIILPYHSGVSGKLEQQFTSDYFGWYGSLYSVSRKYELWLEEHLGSEVAKIDNDCFDQVNQLVREIIDYYQYSALQFRQRLDEKLDQAFGVHLPEAWWQIDFTGIEKPDISIYQAFDSHLDTLLFFLPMRWFNKLFFRHFHHQIPYGAEKNLYRYISDLTGKIIKTINVIHGQALQFIDSEIKTVENILQQANSNYEVLRGYLERLERIRSETDMG